MIKQAERHVKATECPLLAPRRRFTLTLNESGYWGDAVVRADLAQRTTVYLPANARPTTGRHAAAFRTGRRPIHCPAMPPRRSHSANDNRRNAPPMRRWAWDVYRAAAKARWVGRVEAPTAEAAIEAAAMEFDSDVKKLIAVRCREIA